MQIDATTLTCNVCFGKSKVKEKILEDDILTCTVCYKLAHDNPPIPLFILRLLWLDKKIVKSKGKFTILEADAIGYFQKKGGMVL